MEEGYDHVVDLDLANFFDEVNHDRLLWLLGTPIGDIRVLELIGKFLRAGMLQGGLETQTDQRYASAQSAVALTVEHRIG